jgi:alpha-L-arabinofuranosidase
MQPGFATRIFGGKQQFYRMRIPVFACWAFIALHPAAAQDLPKPDNNSIQIDLAGGQHTISRHIYGHFAEHLGRCIYGGFYVGEKSPIPNTAGVRKDVVEALKKLKIPNLRWPGGCFADTYHWQDGIGPKAKRPAMLNIWWGNTREDNSFGTHEFLNMCELLGAEPYLSGNVGSGTSQELADWIKYTTHPNGSSPMTDLRFKNGRKTPWKVTYWGIGNEAWGCGGNMTAEYYANVYRQFATFMTNWNNSDGLYRIASGASDADYHWTEVLMKNIPKNMIDAVALHHYSVIDWNKKGSATAFDEETYFKTMQKALLMDELIVKHTAIMDQHDPQNKVALVVDEWGGWYDVEPGTNGAFLYQQNTLRDAVLAGATLNIFNNHCKRVKMANLAQAINVLQAVILTDKEKMLLTPTYHVMEMYAVHHDAVLLPVQVKSADYAVGTEKLKAVWASASRDKAGRTHISLVNVDMRKPQTVQIEFKGAAAFKNVSGRILTSDKAQNHNTFDNPNSVVPVAFGGAQLAGETMTAVLPPASVTVLELK